MSGFNADIWFTYTVAAPSYSAGYGFTASFESPTIDLFLLISRDFL